jgi:ribosome recycling factor
MPTIPAVKSQMESALEALRREFSTVRTGKATPALLDSVRVEAYGSTLPLNQVASISTPESSLLLVQPFDQSLITEITKAIVRASLGLNPANDGKVIRVPIPPLTEERRKEYVKLLHKMAEEGRISIRHARRDGNEEIKKRTKDGELSEDESRRAMDEIQKLTDQHSAKIEEMLAAKEREVMTV